MAVARMAIGAAGDGNERRAGKMGIAQAGRKIGGTDALRYVNSGPPRGAAIAIRHIGG